MKTRETIFSIMCIILMMIGMYNILLLIPDNPAKNALSIFAYICCLGVFAGTKTYKEDVKLIEHLDTQPSSVLGSKKVIMDEIRVAKGLPTDEEFFSRTSTCRRQDGDINLNLNKVNSPYLYEPGKGLAPNNNL